MQAYTIQPGDTLDIIAARFNLTVQEIIAVNKFNHPLYLLPGQVILLPVNTDPITFLKKEFIYVAHPGNTIYSITKKFNIPMTSIIKSNKLTYPYIIYPGQKLILPEASSHFSTRPPDPQFPLSKPDESVSQQTARPLLTTTYLVKPGDSLSSIAQYFNTSIETIKVLNNISNQLYPGQKLLIPPIGIKVYTVRAGDTIYKLARKFNTTPEGLSLLNNIKNQKTLYPGQKLLIPPPGTTIYLIKPGDTLYSIAQKYDVDINTIIKVNRIENPNLILPDQILIIPLSRRFK